jgi:hypothetical protein
MIQVREVFQLHFGRAREAIALAREGIAIEEKHGGIKSRLLTDLTGEYYTLIMESEHESLAAFEQGLEAGMANEEFRAWYPRFAALARGGRREIYRIVDAPTRLAAEASDRAEALVGA